MVAEIAAAGALLGASPPYVIIALVALVGFGVLSYFAVFRFELFTLMLLFVRPLLDLGKGRVGTALAEPTLVTGFMLLAGGSIWLYANRDSIGRYVQPRSPLIPAGAAFLIIALLASIGSAQPLVSLEWAIRVAGGLMVFFVVFRLLSSGLSSGRVISVMFASAVGPMVLAVIGPSIGIQAYHFKDGIRALRSTFFLSNNFAHFLAPLIILAIAFAIRSTGRRQVLAIVGAASMLVALVATVTRGAWVAVIVGVVVLGVMVSRRLVAATLALSVLSVIFIPPVTARFVDLLPDPSAPRAQSSLGWRIDHWQELIGLAGESPILGLGPGMSVVLSTSEKAPHNDFVRAYVEMGLIGLIVYVVLVATVLYVVFRAIRFSLTPFEKTVTLGIAAYSVGFVVASLAENLMGLLSFLWVYMPLLAISARIAHRSSGPAPKRRSERSSHVPST